jgi:hypothetical protein
MFDKEGEFHGKCFDCGETGHRGYECPNTNPTAASVFEQEEEIAMSVIKERNRE